MYSWNLNIANAYPRFHLEKNRYCSVLLFTKSKPTIVSEKNLDSNQLWNRVKSGSYLGATSSRCILIRTENAPQKKQTTKFCVFLCLWHVSVSLAVQNSESRELRSASRSSCVPLGLLSTRYFHVWSALKAIRLVFFTECPEKQTINSSISLQARQRVKLQKVVPTATALPYPLCVWYGTPSLTICWLEAPLSTRIELWYHLTSSDNTRSWPKFNGQYPKIQGVELNQIKQGLVDLTERPCPYLLSGAPLKWSGVVRLSSTIRRRGKSWEISQQYLTFKCLPPSIVSAFGNPVFSILWENDF